MIVYCIILIFLYTLLCLNIYFRAQKLWEWVNHHWYSYQKFLLPEEIQYIQYCLQLTRWDYLLRPITGILWPYLPGLSSFTYGVQYTETETETKTENNENCEGKGESMSDRSRCGFGVPCGEILGRDKLRKMAQAVLQARGLPETIQFNKDRVFYGLAWHGKEKTLRIYWKVPIQSMHMNTIWEDKKEKVWDIGLYARTWNWETGECVDEKEYVLEKDFKGTWMHTRNRGWVYQSNDENIEELPPTLKKDKEEWEEITGLKVDTISHWKNTWVLYFPRISLFSSFHHFF